MPKRGRSRDALSGQGGYESLRARRVAPTAWLWRVGLRSACARGERLLPRSTSGMRAIVHRGRLITRSGSSGLSASTDRRLPRARRRTPGNRSAVGLLGAATRCSLRHRARGIPVFDNAVFHPAEARQRRQILSQPKATSRRPGRQRYRRLSGPPDHRSGFCPTGAAVGTPATDAPWQSAMLRRWRAGRSRSPPGRRGYPLEAAGSRRPGPPP